MIDQLFDIGTITIVVLGIYFLGFLTGWVFGKDKAFREFGNSLRHYPLHPACAEYQPMPSVECTEYKEGE